MPEANQIGSQLLPKHQAWCCGELDCTSKYVRQSDLRRHQREAHTEEEYLCPVSKHHYTYECTFHRKGLGFKRMHRLVSHLKKPHDSHHPRVRNYTEAELVARDYNDHLQALQMGSVISFAEGDTSDPDSGGWEINAGGVPSRYSDAFMYTRWGSSFTHIPVEHLRSMESMAAFWETEHGKKSFAQK